MIRVPLFAAAVISALVIAGCENDAKQQQEKAAQAQAEADKKAADARMEAERRATQAQAEADKKIADAQANFARLVEDYRHKANVDLVELDKKIDELDAKAKKEKGKAKTDLEGKLTQIRASRDAYVADLKSLETGTAASWDTAKARVDKKWTDLKALVEGA